MIEQPRLPEDLQADHSPAGWPSPERDAEPLGFPDSAQHMQVKRWRYQSLEAFVPIMMQMWCVKITDASGGRHWCPKWWDHPSIVARFQLLWRAWEEMVDEPLGVLQWTQHYLDPQMEFITSPTGPLANCTSDRHSEDPVTPVRWDDPPEGVLP